MFKVALEDFDIEKIAESGQCFRMKKLPMDEIYEVWQIIAINKYCIARYDPLKNETWIDCPREDNMFWMYYFDLNDNYEKYRRSVDENDLFLRAAVEYGKGIRILNQNPWEMLITYIISQRRSIQSIRTCVEKLCISYGDELAEGIYAFPTAFQLTAASIDDLNKCGLGYRSEYVYLAAKAVMDGTVDLLGYDSLSDEDLVLALEKLRGVGPKVANCVSLFGYHRIAAFPVDVWIDRVQKQFYMGRFPVELYKDYAGIMQQYIFYYIRHLDKAIA